METVNTLIIVFAVIAVAGSAAGVFLYDPPPSPKDFVVNFTEEEHDVDGRGTLGGDGTEQVAVNVPFPNVTALELKVTITPGGGPSVRTGQTTATIVLSSPDGAEADRATLTWESTNTAAKNAPLEVPAELLAALPDPVDTKNLTLEDAEAWAAGQFTNRTATGTWEVTVTISGAGTVPQQQTFAIQVSGPATHYHGEARPQTRDISGAA